MDEPSDEYQEATRTPRCKHTMTWDRQDWQCELEKGHKGKHATVITMSWWGKK